MRKESMSRKARGTRKNGKRPRPLVTGQSTYSLAIKCYPEQLPGGTADGWGHVCAAIRGMDPSEYHAAAITHDRDGKAHYHVAIVCKGGSRPHAGTILKRLGITFRDGADDGLAERRGLETVGSFPAYLEYMMHQPPAAAEAGKARYGPDDLVSNLSGEVIRRILDGQRAGRLNKNDMDRYASEAEAAGYRMEGFGAWLEERGLQSLPPRLRSSLGRAFQDGRRRYADEGNHFNRLCILIAVTEDMHDAVTEAARHATGCRNICTIDAPIAGVKALSWATEAVIFHLRGFGYVDCAERDGEREKVLHALRLLSGSYACSLVEARGRDSIWMGKVLVVIADYDLFFWARAYDYEEGEFADLDSDPHDIRTYNIPDIGWSASLEDTLGPNFISCHVDDSLGLHCDSISSVGRQDHDRERELLYKEFRERFTRKLREIQKHYGTTNFDGINY